MFMLVIFVFLCMSANRWYWCGGSVLGCSHFQCMCRVCKLCCRHIVVS